MKKLPVDLDELALALEHDDSGDDAVYWFDTGTGEVLFVSSHLEEGPGQIGENASARFVRIDSIDSRERFRLMEGFVQTVPVGEERDRLESSLRGPRPFSRFKDSLGGGQWQDQWHAFRSNAVRRSAIAWLAALGIQAEGVEDTGSPSTKSGGGTAENDDRNFRDTSERWPGEAEIRDQEIDFEDQLGQPISDEEESELAGFVASLSDGRFDFPKFHGLLTAFTAGPVSFAPPEILQVLSQKSKAEPPILDDASPSEKILELIARLQNEIVLDLDGKIFEPESFEREHLSGEIYPDTFSWCEGFVLGINHHSEVWEKWYKDWRRKKAISAIEAAANREFRSSGDYFETAEKMWALFDLIERVVPLIRCFWRLESELDEIVGYGSAER